MTLRATQSPDLDFWHGDNAVISMFLNLEGSDGSGPGGRKRHHVTVLY
jgi:hypothetical protein